MFATAQLDQGGGFSRCACVYCRVKSIFNAFIPSNSHANTFESFIEFKIVSMQLKCVRMLIFVVVYWKDSLDLIGSFLFAMQFTQQTFSFVPFAYVCVSKWELSNCGAKSTAFFVLLKCQTILWIRHAANMCRNQQKITYSAHLAEHNISLCKQQKIVWYQIDILKVLGIHFA